MGAGVSLSRALAGLLLVLVLAVPASAKGKPVALTLGVLPADQSTSWIEQQDDWPQPPEGEYVVSVFPPSCTWSNNDHYEWFETGNMAPGASSSRTFCTVSDFDPVLATRNGVTAFWHMAEYGFFGLSVSQGLNASVCYQPQGRCFQVARAFCGRVHYDAGDANLVDIEGSRGGRGVVTSVTVTVTNPNAKRLRNVSVQGGISSDAIFPPGCETLPDQNDYPFEWATG